MNQCDHVVITQDLLHRVLLMMIMKNTAAAAAAAAYAASTAATATPDLELLGSQTVNQTNQFFHEFDENITNQSTDGPTNEATDEQALLQRCEDASKKNESILCYII